MKNDSVKSDQSAVGDALRYHRSNVQRTSYLLAIGLAIAATILAAALVWAPEEARQLGGWIAKGFVALAVLVAVAAASARQKFAARLRAATRRTLYIADIHCVSMDESDHTYQLLLTDTPGGAVFNFF